MRTSMGLAVAVVWVALGARCVLAQQTAGVIAAVVRDVRGGVIPGVTVEVASPAFIERVRTAVTGNDGQYRIVELRLGVYTVHVHAPGVWKARARERATDVGVHRHRKRGAASRRSCRNDYCVGAPRSSTFRT